MAITTIQGILMVGDRASQPAANTVAIGALYAVDDEDYLIEQSDGAAWNQWGPTPGGAGSVTTGVTLTDNRLVVGAGSSAIKVSDLTGAVTTSGGVATTLANDAVTTAKILNANVTLAKIANAAANARVVGSGAAGSGAAYTELTLSEILDFIGSAAHGDILYRDSATWARLAAGSAGEVLTTAGAGADPSWEPAAGGGTAIPGLVQYRLSATTAVPVTTGEVTTTSTLYWVPYKGNVAYVYDGADWQLYNGGELSIALSSLTSAKNYDVFLDYNGGTEQLVLVAWTNDTTRATALTTQDGVYVLNGATDHLYLGTIRTIATNATCDFGGGSTTQVGGRRYIWNYYNRVLRTLSVFDAADTWTYNSATWRVANGATGPLNCVEMVVGVVEEPVMAQLNSHMSGTTNGNGSTGINSTSTAGLFRGGASSGGGGLSNIISVRNTHTPVAGYNYVSWLESVFSGTATFYGDAGAGANWQSGMTVEIRN